MTSNEMRAFKNGYEMCVLDCADALDGEYGFEDDGNEYVVIIEEK